MPDSRFEINRRGFAECAIGPEVKAAVMAIAEKAKAQAEALATEFAQTGNYANSFEVFEETVTDGDKYHHPRAAAILENTASYADVVEAGHLDKITGREISGHHVLQRTLDALAAQE
jgi:hypothetical protein